MSETDMETGTDVRAAYVRLLEMGRREFYVFTRDLEERWLGADEVLEAIKTFALQSRHARVQILAIDIRRAVRDGHRLLDLARRLSSKVEIRIVDKRHQDEVQAYAVADGRGFMHRPVADRATGVLAENAPRRARDKRSHFKEVWMTATSDPNLRALDI